jgi:hypothetical protein
VGERSRYPDCSRIDVGEVYIPDSTGGGVARSSMIKRDDADAHHDGSWHKGSRSTAPGTRGVGRRPRSLTHTFCRGNGAATPFRSTIRTMYMRRCRQPSHALFADTNTLSIQAACTRGDSGATRTSPCIGRESYGSPRSASRLSGLAWKACGSAVRRSPWVRHEHSTIEACCVK